MKRSWAAIIGVTLAALLSLFGLAVSGVLLHDHLSVEIGGDPLFSGMCNDGSGNSSCDDVLASKWGKLDLSQWGVDLVIPTAMLGFVFFAAMSSWYIAVGRPSGTRRWLYVFPLVGATAGAAICGWLDYIMFKSLPFCRFCFATHVASWVLLLLTLLLWPRRRVVAGPVVVPTGTAAIRPEYTPLQDAAYPPYRLVLAAVLMATAISAAGWSAYRYYLEKSYSKEYFARWQDYEKDYAARYDKFMAQKPVDVRVLPEDPIRGPVDAPHTLVLFTDFQCPYCKILSALLEERRKDSPELFRIVFKHYPMNRECNPHVRSTLHAASCEAAVTAEAALKVGGQEAFWKMHDELFKEPGEFAAQREQFTRQACEQIGIAYDSLTEAKNSALARIKANTDEGHALAIRGTPTMYFDGRYLTSTDRHDWEFLLKGKPRATSEPASEPAETQVSPPRPTPPAVKVVPTQPSVQPPKAPQSKPTTTPMATRPAPATSPADYVAAYAKFMAQPQVEIPIMSEDPVRGPAEAPHTVIVFTDLQCPFSRGLWAMLDQRLKEYPDQFRVVFKHFPMNKTCNDHLTGVTHKAACATAVTAEAALRIGGPDAFWKMFEELFRDQQAFARGGREFVRQVCEKLGLDNDALWKNIQTRSIWDRIRINADQGSAVGVEGTPTMFFDGREMGAWGDRDMWQYLLHGGPAKASQPTSSPAAP